MAGVHITPVQVTGNNGAGVSVAVNSCRSIPRGSSMAQSQSGPQVTVPRRGVTITPIQSSQPKPIIIGKALLKAVSKKKNWEKTSFDSKNFHSERHQRFNSDYLFPLEGINTWRSILNFRAYSVGNLDP